MRTTVDLDESLLKRAWALTKPKTKTELIEAGLQALIEKQSARAMLAFEGQFKEVKAPARRRPKHG